ncbi:MAG: ribosomal protein S18-alanine N-acetyltransferase [Comamonadaceae bacterium]|nr:ribosomal protein S18-alanine N-acetyltransferase [Comamonadaceae bacterium]
MASAATTPAADPAPAAGCHWRAMALDDLDAVLPIEHASHSHPWSRGNFADSIATGFYMPCLWQDQRLLAYLVAMPGVDEAHLLNITVAPACRGLGLGRLLLQALECWALRQRAAQLWLEVRQGNARAQAVYAAAGYQSIAVRKHYYPRHDQQREHAIVMRKTLAIAPAPAAGGA